MKLVTLFVLGSIGFFVWKWWDGKKDLESRGLDSRTTIGKIIDPTGKKLSVSTQTEEEKVFFLYEVQHPPFVAVSILREFGLEYSGGRIFGWMTPHKIAQAQTVIRKMDVPKPEMEREKVQPAVDQAKPIPGENGTESVMESVSVIPSPAAVLSGVDLEEEQRVTFVYQMRNRSLGVEEIAFLQKWEFRYDEGTRRVFGRGTREEIDGIEDFLSRVDVLPEQVTLEAAFLNATLEEGKAFSFEWFLQFGASGLPLFENVLLAGKPDSIVLSHELFAVSLQGAVTAGAVDVLSRPKLGVVLGETASLSSGSQVGIATSNFIDGVLVQDVDFREIGFEVSIVVDRHGEDYRLAIEQKSEEITGTAEVAGNSIPEIASQSLKSTVIAPEGFWCLVGGIRVDRSEKTRQRARLPISFAKRDREGRAEIVLAVRVRSGIEADGTGVIVGDSVRVPVELPSVECAPVAETRKVTRRTGGRGRR